MKHDREVSPTTSLSKSARQISANQVSREAAIESLFDLMARLLARVHARENRLKLEDDLPAATEKARRRTSASTESEIASGPVAQEATNGERASDEKETT
jgi:hypothetical protein